MPTTHPAPPQDISREVRGEDTSRRAALAGAVIALCVALIVTGVYLATGESTRSAPPYHSVTAVPSAGPPANVDGASPQELVPGSTPPTPLTYWPGPTTTGVPAGTVLSKRSGTLNLRTAGEILSNVNLTGCINVYASNVQILRSRITCDRTTFAVRVMTGARNLILRDVEINGSGRTSTAVCCTNFIIDRANIYNTIDGPRLGDNTTVTNSYLHSLSRLPGSHNDTLQTTGGSNITIQHNRIEPYIERLNDPNNACLMVGSTTSPSVNNLLFVDNYCNGGNYAIGIRVDLVGTSIRFIRNKYGRDYRYGIIGRPNQAGIYWERSTNVWFDNGQPVIP